MAFDPAGEASARCSCPAARSRAFCKHAAAVLVAWARQPGSFAGAAAPPVAAGEGDDGDGAGESEAAAGEAGAGANEEANEEANESGARGGAGKVRDATKRLRGATNSKAAAEEAATAMRRGVEQVEALVRDLATAGVAS
ncbi:MAG: SWIM zinc finger domain-containing protein, partial [Polyangiaceae bacterium]|nr:SWIM zinc finger domain-containing protein [Polyangiaceae bacterium]